MPSAGSGDVKTCLNYRVFPSLDLKADLPCAGQTLHQMHHHADIKYPIVANSTQNVWFSTSFGFDRIKRKSLLAQRFINQCKLNLISCCLENGLQSNQLQTDKFWFYTFNDAMVGNLLHWINDVTHSRWCYQYCMCL